MNGPPAMGIGAGEIVAGKFRVEKVLGAGGMGIVIAARHLQLDERVALKFLLPEALANPEAVARFLREARAAVKIKGEHVARVSDVGTLADGTPYMVMEYLDGIDLAAWLDRYGALPIHQAVEFVLQACVAVAEAHGLGIVHRDLKPSNLFCIRHADGELAIKVLDFGISKMDDPGGTAARGVVTQSSSVMGSPLYMSPEQMHSPKAVDSQTDIWSLGVILFELLTHQVPFPGDTVPEVAVRVATLAPPPPRSLRPDMDSGLDAVILKCLEKDRASRYRNVAELALDLAPFASRRAQGVIDRISGIVREARLPAGPAPASPPDVSATRLPPVTVAPVGRTLPMSSRSRRAAWGAALGLIVAVAVGGSLLLTGRGSDRHADPRPAAEPSIDPTDSPSAPRRETLRTLDPPPQASVFPTPTATETVGGGAAPPPHPSLGPPKRREAIAPTVASITPASSESRVPPPAVQSQPGTAPIDPFARLKPK